MGPTTVLRRRRPLLAWAAAVVLLLVAIASWFAWNRPSDGQSMSIRDDFSAASGPWPTPAPRTARTGELPFVTSVSRDGRYFLDQYGKPLLVKGDSPWSLLTQLSPQQAELWFAKRQQQGFNAAIFSLIGAASNGGVDDEGSTFDGLTPFVDGDILQWQEPYWERATAYLRKAAEHGITVMLYPIDGWTIGRSFVPTSTGQCHAYGVKLAERFRDLPNIVWLSGGDYFPAARDEEEGSDVDHCIDAMMRGIRETGDGRPFSVQLGYDKSLSTDNAFWARRVDWNFVYTYYPTYRAVLEAYAHRPEIPAVMSEANYEGENNHPDTPDTTDETLRRQVLWALTSGACGEFVGSDDWEFHPGWEQRLSTPAVAQIGRLRALFSGLTWWELAPDTTNELVTAGRGTEVTTDRPMDVLDSDYVTAAKTRDGRLAVIYIPTARTISVSPSALASGARAEWIDPVSGERRPAPMSATFTTPAANAGGDGDWLLLLTS